MKKILLTLLSLALLPLSALCEKVTVNLEKEGTLETVISEQTVADITELKIVGPITASDIKFLRASEGKIANLESLDLSEVTLVASNEPYAQDGPWSIYYLTEEEKSWTTSASGMYMVEYCHYGSMNLSMAFAGMLLETVILPSSMTKIGFACFRDCKLLTKVVVPESVTTIDDEAFNGALSLKSIDIANTTGLGDMAFSGCTLLTEIDISKVKTIGKEAFKGCTSLASVSISDQAELSEGVFSDCTGLNDVSFPANLKAIPKSAFSKCTGIKSISLPEDLETIGESAFEGCTFASVVLPNSIKTISAAAFKGCSNIGSIDLPNSLETLEQYAFSGCKITSITFPGSLKYIGASVFSNLESITFTKGDGGLKIGESAFYGIKSLKSVDFAEGLESIGYRAFLDCYGLESVILPEGLKYIGGDAFSGIWGLTSVTLPSTLEFIGDGAFSGTQWQESQVADDDGIMYYGNVAMRCTIKSESGIAIKFKEGTRGVSSYFGSGTTITSVEFPSSVRHIGRSAFENQGITSLVLNEGLEIIDPYAFDGCKSLTSVVIPESVKELGENFRSSGVIQMTVKAKHLSKDSRLGNIDNLSKLTIGSGVEVLPDEFVNVTNNLRVTFEERSAESSLYLGTKSLPCSKMSSLKLPNCRIALGKEALKGASFEFEIPGVITEIGESALSGTGVSGTIRLSDDVTTINKSVFSGCSGLTSVNIPDGVTSIGYGAFSGCSGLTSITIPDGVTSIDDYVFEGCTGLASVNIPNGVTYIGWQAFNNCALTSITIPNSVTTINDMAFVNCTALASVTIGNGVTSIGGSAFDDCTSLTEVNISDLVAWCNIDFEGSSSNPLQYAHHLYLNGEEIKEMVIPDGVTSIDNHAFYNCSSLESVTIPESVTSIGEYAFRSCSKLTSIKIPKNVTSFGSYAFGNCSSLTHVTIDNGVTSISDGAFLSCNKLTSVTIPNSVSSIGEYAFDGCYSISSVISYIQEPFEIGYNIFENNEKTILYVPAGTKDKYESVSYWNRFKNIVEMISGDTDGDGNLTQSDVESTAEYIMTGKITKFHKINADVNNDGKIDVVDIVKMINIIKSKKSSEGIDPEAGAEEP